MLFVSLGSFILTQPKGVLSPWRKGTLCFYLCEFPSVAFTFSIILSVCCKLASNIKTLFKNVWFLEAEIRSGNVFSHDHPKRDLEINFSTRVWNYINSNYATFSQEKTCCWKSSAHHHRSTCQTEPLSAVSHFAVDYTQQVTCEAHNSLIQACSNLPK